MKKLICEYLDYIKFILSMIKIKIRPIIILCFLGIMTSILGGIIVPYISKYLMDTVIQYKKLEGLTILLPIIGIVYLVYMVLDIINSYVSINWKVSTDFDMKCNFYNLMNTKCFLDLSKVDPTDLFYRMFMDGQIMSKYLYTLFITMPCSIIFCFIIFIVMVNWSWQMALYSIVLMVINILSIVILRKPIKKINGRLKKVDQGVIEFVMEKLRLISFAQVNGITRWWEDQVASKFLHAQKITTRNTFITTIFNNLSDFFQQLWSIGYIILGVYLIFKGYLTIGGLFGFQSLISYFMSPLSNIVLGIFAFQDTKVSYDRYAEYCSFKPIITGSISKLEKCTELKFNNVSFSYPKSYFPVIREISCEFSNGTITSVVGPNGTGKTTLMMIAARLLLPDYGKVTINDVNINNISLDAYNKIIGIMNQKTIIFHDTFINNLVMGEEYSKEEIEYVSGVCGLNHIIDKLPEKELTVLGKEGVNLSGGESQRLSLARVLLKQPHIVWLDEPTASIDEESSYQIMSALINYKNKYNAIIIINTHSNYIIKSSDYVTKL